MSIHFQCTIVIIDLELLYKEYSLNPLRKTPGTGAVNIFYLLVVGWM